MYLEVTQLEGNDPRIVVNLKNVMLATPAQSGKSTNITLVDGRELMIKIPYEDYKNLCIDRDAEERVQAKKEKEAKLKGARS
jgi:hypothetical protein